MIGFISVTPASPQPITLVITTPLTASNALNLFI